MRSMILVAALSVPALLPGGGLCSYNDIAAMQLNAHSTGFNPIMRSFLLEVEK